MKTFENASKVRENDIKTGPKNVKLFQFDEQPKECIDEEINTKPNTLVDQVENLGK